MDYKKEYEAMVQRARELHEGGNALTKQQMEIVCPELAESEEERIRKELVAFFIEVRNREGDEGYWHDLKVSDILAYLEKQKEPKPAEWSKKDEKMLTSIIERGSSQVPFGAPPLREVQKVWLMNRLKSIRPQSHWKPSEEQMEALKRAADNADDAEDASVLLNLCKALKKL